MCIHSTVYLRYQSTRTFPLVPSQMLKINHHEMFAPNCTLPNMKLKMYIYIYIHNIVSIYIYIFIFAIIFVLCFHSRTNSRTSAQCVMELKQNGLCFPRLIGTYTYQLFIDSFFTGTLW